MKSFYKKRTFSGSYYLKIYALNAKIANGWTVIYNGNSITTFTDIRLKTAKELYIIWSYGSMVTYFPIKAFEVKNPQYVTYTLYTNNKNYSNQTAINFNKDAGTLNATIILSDGQNYTETNGIVGIMIR